MAVYPDAKGKSWMLSPKSSTVKPWFWNTIWSAANGFPDSRSFYEKYPGQHFLELLILKNVGKTIIFFVINSKKCVRKDKARTQFLKPVIINLIFAGDHCGWWSMSLSSELKTLLLRWSMLWSQFARTPFFYLENFLDKWIFQKSFTFSVNIKTLLGYLFFVMITVKNLENHKIWKY